MTVCLSVCTQLDASAAVIEKRSGQVGENETANAESKVSSW